MKNISKEALEFIFNAQESDAIMILEGFVFLEKSTQTDREVIAINLKDQSNTHKKIKEIIGNYGLDTQGAVSEINKKIFAVLKNKSTLELGRASITVIKDSSPEPDLDTGGAPPNMDIDARAYLNDMEQQSFFSVYDKAYDTHCIDGLSDFTIRNYRRIAGAKIKIMRLLAD